MNNNLSLWREMSENLKHVEKDGDFQEHLKEAETKLVVVDFYADWCSHCKNMGPVFERLAPKYPLAVFLKVNVDECTDTAISHKVKCLPSFFFIRHQVKLDGYCGGDVQMLEDKIKKWYTENKDRTTLIDKHINLESFIDLGKCECLNESQEHALENALTTRGYLESGSSSKLMITIVFTELVNVQSLLIHGPSDCGPKTVKLFVNQPKICDFQDAEEMKSSQTLELMLEDLDKNTPVQLCCSKFQDVSNLTMYIAENQDCSKKTQIDRLAFFGSPVKTCGELDSENGLC